MHKSGPSPKAGKPASSASKPTAIKGTPGSTKKAAGGSKAAGLVDDAAGREFLKNLKGEDWGEQFDKVEPSQEELEREIMGLVETSNSRLPDVELTLELVLKTNVSDDQNLVKAPAVLRDQFFGNLTHVRLDRCHLPSLPVEVLLQLPAATHMYLQHNRIASMGSVAVLKALQFLTLSHNQISQVDGIASLQQLMFLDVTCNKLDHPQRSHFPESLRILKIDGNPFLHLPDRGSQMLDDMLEGLPHLRDLDVEDEDDEPLKDLQPSSVGAEVPGQDASITKFEGALQMLEVVERSALHRSSNHVQMKVRASCDRLSTVRASTEAHPRPSSSQSDTPGLAAASSASSTPRGSSARLPPSSGRSSPAPSRRNVLPTSQPAGRPSSGSVPQASYRSSADGAADPNAFELAIADDLRLLEESLADILEPRAGVTISALRHAQVQLQGHHEHKKLAAQERLRQQVEVQNSLTGDIRTLKASAATTELVTDLKKRANLRAPPPVTSSRPSKSQASTASPPTQHAPSTVPMRKPGSHMPGQHGLQPGQHVLQPVQEPPGKAAAAAFAAASVADIAAARSGVSLADLRSPLPRLERISSLKGGPPIGRPLSGDRLREGGPSGGRSAGAKGNGGRAGSAGSAGRARGSSPSGRDVVQGDGALQLLSKPRGLSTGGTAGRTAKEPLPSKQQLALPVAKPLFVDSDDSGDDDDEDEPITAFGFKTSLPPNPFHK